MGAYPRLKFDPFFGPVFPPPRPVLHVLGAWEAVVLATALVVSPLDTFAFLGRGGLLGGGGLGGGPLGITSGVLVTGGGGLRGRRGGHLAGGLVPGWAAGRDREARAPCLP